MRLFYFLKQQVMLFFRKRGRRFLLFISIFLLLFALPGTADAIAVIGQILDFGKNAAITLVSTVIGLIADIFAMVFKGATALMYWTIRHLLSITVAPGNDATVEIVKSGWRFSRDLVNGLLLTIFAFIGLATIFRIQSYGMQRTLPKLIIVALLANFSGVLVGLIVDIGNLLANFFISGVRDAAQWESITPNYFNNTSFSSITGELAFHIARILYYLVASLIYLGVVFIFLFRIFVLWTLTILAPLAFAAAILPPTQRFWNQWFGSLVQWAIIGVPISFFVWLSGKALLLSGPDIVGARAANDPMAGSFASFLGPFTALFLLIAGMFISLSMAPGSIRGIVNFTKQAAAVGVGVLGAQTVGRLMSREKAAREQRKETFLSRIEQGTWGMKWKDAKGWQKALATVATPVALPMRWAARTAIRKGVEYGAKQGDTDAGAKKWEALAKSSEILATEKAQTLDKPWIDDKGAWEAVLGVTRAKGGKAFKILPKEVLRRGIEYGTTDDPKKLIDVVKHNPNLLDAAGEDAQKLWGRDAAKMTGRIESTLNPDGLAKDEKGRYKFEELQRLFESPEVQNEWPLQQNAQQQKDYLQNKLLPIALMQKLTTELKETDIENLNKDLIDNQRFREAVVRLKPGRFIRRLLEEWGGLVGEELQQEAERIGLENIAVTNPEFLRMPFTSAGEHLMRHWRPGAFSTQRNTRTQVTAAQAQARQTQADVRQTQQAQAQQQQSGRQPWPPPPPPPPPCLAENTLIDTPSGAIPIQQLQKGMAIWTINSFDIRVPAEILETIKTPAPSTHRVVHLILDDGRELFVSPQHPTGDGRIVDNLSVDDLIDRGRVVVAEDTLYQKGFTYDILPSGDTKLYWANGILVGSTLSRADSTIQNLLNPDLHQEQFLKHV